VSQATFESRLRQALSEVTRRTLVVTLLKRTRAGDAGQIESQGIDRLAEFFASSDFAERFTSEPVLIIDDEADEAGLDNSISARRQGRAARPTPTHQAIGRLRSVFSRHFFVQYTATPQANLLVELSNQLAPDFCELLEPGAGYCGAAEFFPESETHFVEIPVAEVQAVHSESNTPPSSLVEAVRLFFIGAALEDFLAGEAEVPAPRSMLVHPERAVRKHRLARQWVGNIRDQLLDAVEDALANPGGQVAADLARIVERGLRQLSPTVNQAEVVPTALFPMFQARLEDTEIKVINSEDQLTEELEWDEWSCWIFVGGDVLQRGFAMQGLTVTWMPRSAGSGQVDVLLQRGRFFGYRRPYFGYCRVWLPRALHDDYYALFADHETTLWRSLREHLEHGGGLAEWSRVFWLDAANPALRLCRQSTQWFRLRQQEAWASQLWYPEESDGPAINSAARNRSLIEELVGELEWSDAWRSQRPMPAQQHRYATVSAARLADFFAQYTFFVEDAADRAVIRDALWNLVEEGTPSMCAVVDMRPAYSDYYRRQTSPDVPRIGALLGGRSRVSNRADPRYYPGDSAFHLGGEGIPAHSADGLTVQLHRPAIRTADGTRTLTAPEEYLSGGCPFVSVYLPANLRHYRRERAGDRT
jgi:hypothetical protein